MPRTAAQPDTTDRRTSVDHAPLTADDVAEQTDAGSFKRGKGYQRSGHIFGAVRREHTLRARCHGSSGGPYLVEATLASTGSKIKTNPTSYFCNCPRGGFCKHVVALLLTWIEDPESFEVRPPIADLLAGKSPRELVAMIELMVREVPELEELLELPAPVAGTSSREPADEAAIRRQVARALRDDGAERRGRRDDDFGYHYGLTYAEDGYRPAFRGADKLHRIVTLAAAYAAEVQWSNALRICAAFTDELLLRLTSIYDEDGEIAILISQVDELLAACLDDQNELRPDEQLTAEERTRLIDTLFAIWQADVEINALELDLRGPEAIARSATMDEQRGVGERLRLFLRSVPGDDWNRTWRLEATIGFLGLLPGDAGLADEELLTEYRNAELWDEAAAMLLRLGRIEEAVSLATRRLTGATALAAFADQLIASGDPPRVEQGIALVDDRLWEHEGANVREDQTLRAWLERRYAEHGRPEKALELARGRFKAEPSQSTYEAVKLAASLPNQPGDPWPSLRPTLLAALRKHGDWYSLIDIHLAEGETAEAIAALKQSEKPHRAAQRGWGYGWGASRGDYSARVAAAAEAELPDEAIDIYRRLADDLITQRGRGNYQVAAGYLAGVRRVMEASGRAAEWPSLIQELRERNKSLRALREELDALGLG